MRVGDIRALTEPNVYSHRPVLSMRLYLDDLAGKESREFPGFTATGEFRFMAGNQNNQLKANNDRHKLADIRMPPGLGVESQLLKGAASSEVARL